MKENESTVTINCNIDFPVQRVSDLLCCALEGGSNYWYEIDEFGEPPGWNKPLEETFRHLEYPTTPGGYIVISDYEDSKSKRINGGKVDLNRLVEALQMMATDKRYSNHFNDFMQGNEDAITGDVFLQLAVFGDVIYG